MCSASYGKQPERKVPLVFLDFEKRLRIASLVAEYWNHSVTESTGQNPEAVRITEKLRQLYK